MQTTAVHFILFIQKDNVLIWLLKQNKNFNEHVNWYYFCWTFYFNMNELSLQVESSIWQSLIFLAPTKKGKRIADMNRLNR